MKQISLTQGKVALVDNEDYPELSKHKWCAVEYHNVWYARRRFIKGKNVFMHREILGLKFGDGIKTDHWNHNGLDNQRHNLRICTNAENCRNQRVHKHSSMFKGVTWWKTRQKWMARIYYNYKQIHLGYFDSEIEAAKVYDRAALKYHGEFAKLNFPLKRSA